MSKASIAFLESIKDAEELLQHFDAINIKPPPPNAEVLKRAGLIMALTAWETYVEDRATEALGSRLCVIAGSPVAAFVSKKFEEEIKRLHNPSSEKTRKLFIDYFAIDVTAAWRWADTDPERACKTLDGFLAKRGAAAHRSDAASMTKAQVQGHLVKREDLDRIIRFLRLLVERTETAF